MIKLTTIKGEPYYVNLDLVESMFRLGGATLLVFNSGREVQVKETAPAILAPSGGASKPADE
jgi:uncharacterized protein YlzI (FlbEa/FlbD family)